MNPPYPMLWFDTEATDAARLYTSLFPDSGIRAITRYPEGIPGRNPGDVMMVDFTLKGTRMTALNGGPDFSFSEAVSLVVECEDQAEIDRLWGALTAGGGRESMCGWLVDRFGLSWQIVPNNIAELITPPRPWRRCWRCASLTSPRCEQPPDKQPLTVDRHVGRARV